MTNHRVALALMVFGACGGGGGDDPGVDAGADAAPDAPQVQPCALEAEKIYVLQHDHAPSAPVLGTLDLAEERVDPIGQLGCLPIDRDPINMAVDRAAGGWLTYADGRVFRFDPVKVVCEQVTVPPSSFGALHLAFVLDGPGARSEHGLFAGVKNLATQSLSTIGTFDPETLALTPVTTAIEFRSLAGSADGRLWGLALDMRRGVAPRVDEFDPETLALFGENSVDIFAQQGPASFFGFHGHLWVSTSVPDFGAEIDEVVPGELDQLHRHIALPIHLPVAATSTCSL